MNMVSEEAQVHQQMTKEQVLKALKAANYSAKRYLLVITRKFPSEDPKDSLDRARREAVWDDDARKDVRNYQRAERIRSEYQAIYDRRTAEGAN